MTTLPPRVLSACFAVFLAAATLSACAQFERHQPSAQSQVDDDALCRQKGAPGSADYAACLKDRDAAVARENRMERAHRGLAERMLNSQ